MSGAKAAQVATLNSRNDKELTFSVKPKFIDGEDTLGNKINKKIIGIQIAPLNEEIKRERLGPATALFYAVKETWFVIEASWSFIISLIKGTGDTSQSVSYTHLTLPTILLV